MGVKSRRTMILHVTVYKKKIIHLRESAAYWMARKVSWPYTKGYVYRVSYRFQPLEW